MVKTNREDSGNGYGKVIRVDTPVRKISKDFDESRNIQQVNGTIKYYSFNIISQQFYTSGKYVKTTTF